MSDTAITVRMNMPREALDEERAAASADYALQAPAPLPPDPDAVEAHFIDPVTVIAVVTIAMLAWRIINHYLVRDGRGVLIDARQTPPVVSRLDDVPAGFIVLVKADGTSETIAAGKCDDTTLASLIKQALPAAA